MSPMVLFASGAEPVTSPAESLSLRQVLEFEAVGLAIVLAALSLLYLTCATLGAVFRRDAERRARQRVRIALHGAPGTALPPSEVTSNSTVAPPDAVGEAAPCVVIAAAVAAVLHAPHRVVHVVPAPLGWSLEGRRQLLTSHQLRH